MQQTKRLIRKPRWVFALFLFVMSAPSYAQNLLSASSFEYSVARYLLNEALDAHKSQSGTLSLKLADPSMELSMPFVWMGEGLKNTSSEDATCCKHNFASMDFQLRKYQSDQRDGLYAGLVVRGTTSNGYIDGEFQRQTRWGAGATLGYRFKLSELTYWSTGITWVSYKKEFDQYDRVEIDTAENFLEKDSVTYDILKFGILLP